MFSHLFDDHILVINGGPGTGKTSTMIQRLKLLISEDFYNDSDYKQEDFTDGTDIAKLKAVWSTFLKLCPNDEKWVFFSPTIQLQNFLSKNLSAEGLPDPVGATKVWNEKNEPGKNYAFDLARDKYHFVNTTVVSGIRKKSRLNNYFEKKPQMVYSEFEKLLLERLAAKYAEKFKKADEQIKSIGLDRIKSLSTILPQTDSIENYYRTIGRLSRKNAGEAYESIWEDALGVSDETSGMLYSFAKKNADELIQHFESAQGADGNIEMFFRWSMLFYIVEKTHPAVMRNASRRTKKIEKLSLGDGDVSVLRYYGLFKFVMGKLFPEKNFRGFAYVDDLIDQNFVEKFKDAKELVSKGLAEAQQRYDESEPIFKEISKERDDILELERTSQPYSPSEKERIESEYEMKKKNYQAAKDDVEDFEIWLSLDYSNEINWLSGYKELTFNIVRAIAEEYVRKPSKGMDTALKHFAVYEHAKTDFAVYRELQKLLDEVDCDNDLDDFLSLEIKDVYEHQFRKKYGFDSVNGEVANLQPQEHSFLIYAGNKIAKTLFRIDELLFNSIYDKQKQKMDTASSKNGELGYTIVYGYKDSWKVVIGVDEATDFTPMELASIASLGHPRYNSVTLVGDQMQAFNDRGITDWKQLDDGIFDIPCVPMNLSVSYRQSPTLLEMAKTIYKRNMHQEAPYRSKIDGSTKPDPKPLLFKSDDSEECIEWIAQKIHSIQVAEAGLPAVAIFCPTNEKSEIDKIVELLNDCLQHVCKVNSCYSADLSAKVVVYPISRVKGLEFEAAFFYNLDQMDDEHLLEQYLYVGLSRATYYLGATSGNDWNVSLTNDFTTDEEHSNWPKVEN